MSRMNDMAMTIEELRNAATAINDAANWLAQQFGEESEATEKAEASKSFLQPISKNHKANLLLCRRSINARQ